MNKNNILVFTLGVACGAGIAWKVAQKKYEVVQDELHFVDDADIQDDLENSDDGVVDEYKERMRVIGYDTVYHDTSLEKEDNIMTKETPYIISPEEFDDIEDYTPISLTLYADGILADEDDEPVDIEITVGSEALTGFGEYEDDSVFVRNDTLKCDYEILLDQRLYSDVIKGKPGGCNY